jgi:hypothetical protein
MHLRVWFNNALMRLFEWEEKELKGECMGEV